MIDWVAEREKWEWDPYCCHYYDGLNIRFEAHHQFYLRDLMIRREAQRLVQYDVEFNFTFENPSASFRLQSVSGLSHESGLRRPDVIRFDEKPVLWDVRFVPTPKNKGLHLVPLGSNRRIPIPRKLSAKFQNEIHQMIFKCVVPDLESPYCKLREPLRRDFEFMGLMINYCLYNKFPQFIIDSAYRSLPVHQVMSE